MTEYVCSCFSFRVTMTGANSVDIELDGSPFYTWAQAGDLVEAEYLAIQGFVALQSVDTWC